MTNLCPYHICISPIAYIRMRSIVTNISQTRRGTFARNNRRRCALVTGRPGPRLINVNRQMRRKPVRSSLLRTSGLVLAILAACAVFPGFVERFGTATYRGAACLYYFTGYVPQISGRHAISRRFSVLAPSTLTGSAPTSSRQRSARSRGTGINQCLVQKLI